MASKTEKIDWEQACTEYITSNRSMRDIGALFNVHESMVFYHAKRENWLKRRNKFRIKVAKKTETKMVNSTANEWARHIKLFKKIDQQIARILKKYEKDTDKPMDPQDLKMLAATLHDSLKAQKLVAGESTGDETHISFHMKTVAFIKEREKEVEKQNAIDVESES